MCAAGAAGGGTTTLVGVGACDGREDSPACWGGAASSSWVLRGTVCVVSSNLIFILQRTTGAVILHTGMSPGLRFILAWCAMSDDLTISGCPFFYAPVHFYALLFLAYN